MDKVLDIKTSPIPCIWGAGVSTQISTKNTKVIEPQESYTSVDSKKIEYIISEVEKIKRVIIEQSQYSQQLNTNLVKSYHFGLSSDTLIKYNEVIPVINTFISNGVSILINETGSFTIKEGGVYMITLNGYFNIYYTPETYTPELCLELNSKDQSHRISTIEIDSDCVNNFNTVVYIEVKNGETLELKNITGHQHSNGAKNVEIQFHGNPKPLEISLIKIS